MALQAAEKGRNISISRISSKEISSHSNSCIWGNHFSGGCGRRTGDGGRVARRGMESAGLLAGTERAPLRTRCQMPRDCWGAPRGVGQAGWTPCCLPVNRVPFLRRPQGGCRLVLCCLCSDYLVYSFQVFRASSDCIVFRGLSVVKVPYYLVHFFLSRGSSPPRNETWVSCIASRFFID